MNYSDQENINYVEKPTISERCMDILEQINANSHEKNIMHLNNIRLFELEFFKEMLDFISDPQNITQYESILKLLLFIHDNMYNLAHLFYKSYLPSLKLFISSETAFRLYLLKHNNYQLTENEILDVLNTNNLNYIKWLIIYKCCSADVLYIQTQIANNKVNHIIKLFINRMIALVIDNILPNYEYVKYSNDYIDCLVQELDKKLKL